jgi:hypothetical protein
MSFYFPWYFNWPVTPRSLTPTSARQAPSKFFSSAPEDAPAIRVGFVSPAVGYGLFAARDLAQDEFIFHEAPLMTALFNEKFSADKNLMQNQVAAYRGALTANRDVTTVSFPVLAARFGIAPVSYDQTAADVLAVHLGRNLVDGRFAGSTITAEQYDAYTAQLPITSDPSETDARAACLDFFKHYAFDVRSGNGSALAAAAETHEACIYLLGSLVNHCCTPLSIATNKHKPKVCNTNDDSSAASGGPNCSWRIGPSGLAHFVKPRHICVQARRPIRAGEQLTWDYGKREKGFVCECDTCREGFMAGLGDSCSVL